MSNSDVKTLTTAVKHHWPQAPGDKAKRYIGQFFNTSRTGTKIVGQVVGNHGTYTVSIQVEASGVSSACSCYIGKGGYCHHCHALAITFLNDPDVFQAIEPKGLHQVENLTGIEEYLRGVTLDALLTEMRAKGITQKAFAESIGMNPRHLSAVKSSELRNRYYNELGAIKLACLWVMEHIQQIKR